MTEEKWPKWGEIKSSRLNFLIFAICIWETNTFLFNTQRVMNILRLTYVGGKLYRNQWPFSVVTNLLEFLEKTSVTNIFDKYRRGVSKTTIVIKTKAGVLVF